MRSFTDLGKHFSAQKISRLIASFLCILLLTFSFTLRATQNAPSERVTMTVVTSESNAPQYKVTFDGQPRLSALIERGAQWVRNNAKLDLPHNSDPIFWEGAGLFSGALDTASDTKHSDNKNSNSTDNSNKNKHIAKLQRDTLNKLKTLSGIWEKDTQKRDAVLSLSAFIEKSFFRQRFWVETDADSFLVSNNQTQWSNTNPLISHDVILLLPSRLHCIWVVGAVDATKKLAFLPAQNADDYIDDAKPLSMLGVSTVAVIQPDGKLQTHNISYWNKGTKNLAPGAIIFVPFNGLPSALSSLNQDIPSLLQHRVM